MYIYALPISYLLIKYDVGVFLITLVQIFRMPLFYSGIFTRCDRKDRPSNVIAEDVLHYKEMMDNKTCVKRNVLYKKNATFPGQQR